MPLPENRAEPFRSCVECSSQEKSVCDIFRNSRRHAGKPTQSVGLEISHSSPKQTQHNPYNRYKHKSKSSENLVFRKNFRLFLPRQISWAMSRFKQSRQGSPKSITSTSMRCQSSTSPPSKSNTRSNSRSKLVPSRQFREAGEFFTVLSEY